MACKTSIVAVPLILPILLHLAACVPNGEIRIGVSLGPSHLNGVELAVDEINSKGGIRGRKLLLEIDRSGGNIDAALAIKTASAFAADRKIVAVIGHDTSTASLAAAPIYNNSGIVHIAPMSTSPLLSKVGPWTFQVCIDDSQQGRALADYAYDALGKRRTFLFRVGDRYGQSLAAHFNRQFIERGGEIVYRAIYIEKELDFEPFLRLLARLKPDLIFFAGRVEDVIPLRESMAPLDLSIPILGGDALYIADAIEEKASILEGLMMTLFYHPSSGEPGAADFAATYRRRFGRTPDARAALSYDAVYLLKSAIAAGGVNRKELRNSIRSAVSLLKPIAGVSGPLDFDDNRPSDKPLTVGITRDGKVTPVAPQQ